MCVDIRIRFLHKSTDSPDSPIVDLGEAATRLIVVVSGEMTVCVESLTMGNIMDARKYKAGDFIGDFALLGDTVRTLEIFNIPAHY